MTIRPGPRNLITDVPGLAVGSAADETARTGVTVLLPERPVVAAVDIRGGAPGTRETALLDPANSVTEVHAIALAGGSVFGLEAAAGVTNWLAARNTGLSIGTPPGRRAIVPLVPAAILFDLNNGGDKDWGETPPYAALARAACDAAAPDFPLGTAGAGYGAMAGRLKGGLGSASAAAPDGVIVGALAAANTIGSTVMPDATTFWAWPFEQDDEFGGNPPPGAGADLGLDTKTSAANRQLGANTTLAVVATNAALTKAQARRIAIMAHDGMARAVRPAHTPFDGDTVFCLATGDKPLPKLADHALMTIGALAADGVARAIARAVFAATAINEIKAYRDLRA